MLKHTSAEEIDQLLPQTQCGDCGYPGCLPYARAIVRGEAKIDQCLPGGVRVLKNLGKLIKQDITPLLTEMEQRTKPTSIAVIDENLCIGCMKCIHACPVDSIVGTSKRMHTVIAAECTGCTLCIPACPMDCIKLEAIAYSEEEQITRAQTARQRFYAKEERLKKEALEKASEQFHLLKMNSETELMTKRKKIAESVQRVESKRNSASQ